MMADLPDIPSAVFANWRQWWPGEAERVAADVRERLPAAIAAWRLSEPAVLDGGEVGLVLAVRHEGRDAVLKISPRVASGGLAGEGPALALWAQRGLAPPVWGIRDDGLTLLLARVRPGLSLRDTGAGASEILQTIGELCPRIHLDVARDRFATLAQYAAGEGWAARLVGRREHDELLGLLAPGPGDRLLHVDLHWLNVLRGDDRWFVIDPKPHIGDPHAETFAFFGGPPLRGLPSPRPRARAHVQRLADVYARAAGLDRERLEAWIRIRTLAIVAEPEIARTQWGGRLSRLADALS